MAVTVRIHLDKRNQTDESKVFPLKLRVTSDREKRYYRIDAGKINQLLTGDLEKYQCHEVNFSMNETAFQDMFTAKSGAKKRVFNIFMEFERKYQALADTINPFSFDEFKAKYEVQKSSVENDVFTQLKFKARKLRAEERINTAVVYENTSKSLENFSNKKKLKFESVTPEFLNKYAKYMKEQGKSETTTGIYLRHLRELFNHCISEKVTENYPFRSNQNRNGFKIPATRGRKIALTSTELKSIFNHSLQKNDPGRFYVDSWRLMYLLQGINAKDLCLLKYSDIQNSFITFQRAKTKHTGEPVEIKIPVNNQIHEIIELWGNPQEPKENLIWPVITSSDATRQADQVKQFVKLTNKYMKRLAAELEIDKKVTTYVTRHSFATQLMKVGAPVAFISKQLGHTNTKTTDRYMESFEDEQLKEWQKKITDF